MIFAFKSEPCVFVRAHALSCEGTSWASCAFKISKCLPHYTLAVFGAYLCFFSCWAEHLVTLPWLTDCLFCLSPTSVLTAALGIVLTSGCATSRHCQQQELPGVRIHCCDSDLCNSAPSWHPSTLHYVCALFSLLLLRMWLWYGIIWRGTKHYWTMGETFCTCDSHRLS